MVFLNVASLLVLNFAICLHAKLSFLVSFLLLHIKKELPLLSLLEDVKPKLNSDTNGRENRSLSKIHLCFQGLAVCASEHFTLSPSHNELIAFASSASLEGTEGTTFSSVSLPPHASSIRAVFQEGALRVLGT